MVNDADLPYSDDFERELGFLPGKTTVFAAACR
jgi:hypothetical protein